MFRLYNKMHSYEYLSLGLVRISSNSKNVPKSLKQVNKVILW